MRFSKILLLLLSILLLVSCSVDSGDEKPLGAEGSEPEQTPDGKNETEGDGSITRADAAFTMTARVDRIDDVIEVTVIESPHENTGVFWVLTSESTAYFDSDGAPISKGDLKPGDIVRIGWGGQVMMSYPPRISAITIEVTK